MKKKEMKKLSKVSGGLVVDTGQGSVINGQLKIYSAPDTVNLTKYNEYGKVTYRH